MKNVIYYIAKYIGLFALARLMTKRRLRILCYHGFSYNDEYLFRPKLYMRPSLFESRMAILKQTGLPVLELGKAVEKLSDGTLPDNAVVITIDDGWAGVKDFAAPILAEYQFPWTLYLTTYYVQHRLQVVNLMIQYIFWKTTRSVFDYSELGDDFRDIRNLTVDDLSDTFLQKLVGYIDQQDVAHRQDLLRKIGDIMGVDVRGLEQQKMFTLIDCDQARALDSAGVDMQLHTHRHTVGGIDQTKLIQEIQDNRAVMEKICQEIPDHFCYPSGYYAPEHIGWLEDLGIRSATTCEPGLNDHQTNPLALNRFLDGENISQIEFEAELSGFSEILRGLKR